MKTILVIGLLALLFYLGMNANQPIHQAAFKPELPVVQKIEPKAELKAEPKTEEPLSYTIIITEEVEE